MRNRREAAQVWAGFQGGIVVIAVVAAFVAIAGWAQKFLGTLF